MRPQLTPREKESFVRKLKWVVMTSTLLASIASTIAVYYSSSLMGDPVGTEAARLVMIPVKTGAVATSVGLFTMVAFECYQMRVRDHRPDHP